MSSERSGISGVGRVLRRHRLGMLLAFLAAAAVVAGVFEWRWQRAAAAVSAQALPAASASRQEPHSSELLDAMAALFDVEIETTRAQRAERDDALASLDAEVASGAPDAAARTARLTAARRRAVAIAESLTRDRAALVTLQALPAPAPPPPDPQITAANAAVADAEAQLAELERRLTPQHPDVVKQRTVLAERQTAARSMVARAPAVTNDTGERDAQQRVLSERVATAENDQRRTAALIASLEAGGSVSVATDEERARLVRERDTLQAVHDALVAKRAQLVQRAEQLVHAAAERDAAEATRTAASPEAAPVERTLTTTALAASAGGSLAFALLIGFFLDARDTRIHDVGDLRAATTSPLLVSISEIVPTTKPAPSDREVSALPEPSTPLLVWHPQAPRRTVEQYRRLAQALRRLRVDRHTRVIGVTSALPGEGKTLTAVNLAVSLAESFRQRVLLVDADLRRPAVSRLLALSPPEGLADWLRRDDDRDCPSVRMSSRLSVIPAGTPENDPTPLLTSLRMQILIAAARTDFDWVIVDTPPTGLIADAGAIEGSLDGFVVIAASGRTPALELSQTIQALGQDHVLGLVLNRVTRAVGTDSDAYSAYYSTPSA